MERDINKPSQLFFFVGFKLNEQNIILWKRGLMVTKSVNLWTKREWASKKNFFGV